MIRRMLTKQRRYISLSSLIRKKESGGRRKIWLKSKSCAINYLVSRMPVTSPVTDGNVFHYALI